jgi:hypothetical protein
MLLEYVVSIINIVAIMSDQEPIIFRFENTCYNLHLGVTHKLFVSEEGH